MLNVELCQACQEVRFEGGLSWCGLHQRDYPDAVQCARFQPGFQPEPGPGAVHAECGTDLPWTGVAFADNGQ